MTFTKEKLQQIIETDHVQCGDAAAMARHLLAGMSQEPIAWLNDAYLGRGVVDGEAGSDDAGPGYIPAYREPTYTAPPAPVVPDEMPDSVYDILCQACGDKAWMYGDTLWNACRAAMLQGAAGNSPAIPDGYALVPVEPTLNMVKAGAAAASSGMLIPGMYRAMLAAAPTQEVK